MTVGRPCLSLIAFRTVILPALRFRAHEEIISVRTVDGPA